MPFYSEEDINALLEDNANKAGEIAVFRSKGSLIGLADILRDEICLLLEDPDMSPSEIAEAAYQIVKKREIEVAINKVIEEFEEAHRAALQAQLVEEVIETEGEAIYESVRKRYDSDPELVLKLKESARREIAAKALQDVEKEITEEQREAIEIEADRQIELDRLDVEFIVDGELDLYRDDIIELLKPGDTLNLYYSLKSGRQGLIVLRWIKDAVNQEGWAFVSNDLDTLDINGSYTSIKEGRFTYPGSRQHDMSKGREIFTPNLLIKNEPVVLMQEQKDGKIKPLAYMANDYSHGYSNSLLSLQRIDFRAGTLQFN